MFKLMGVSLFCMVLVMMSLPSIAGEETIKDYRVVSKIYQVNGYCKADIWIYGCDSLGEAISIGQRVVERFTKKMGYLNYRVLNRFIMPVKGKMYVSLVFQMATEV